MRNVNRIIAFILFFVLIFISAAYASDEGEGITITCYVANPQGYEYIGELEVFDLSEAASTCNNTYEDCQGNCISCFLDEESLEVCIDKRGNEFERK